MAKDFYETLGLTKSASADEIKKAYRRLALQYHPDRNKTKEAEGKFKEVTTAYEVLSDTQKKQQYDQFGHAAFDPSASQDPFRGSGQGGPFGGQQGGQYGPFTYTYSNRGSNQYDMGGFSDPFDIFEQFFGGSQSGPFGGQQRQRRAVYQITIDFIEAVKGAEKKVAIDGKPQTIKIPAGVDDGTRIRFGNYDILIDVRPDVRFKREGTDIISDKQISFSQAVLGMEAAVETVDGTVKFRIPSGTQPDTIIRLRGKGVPHLRGSGKGDHYVRIKIGIPKNITGRQKQLLEEFEKEGSSKKSWF